MNIVLLWFSSFILFISLPFVKVDRELTPYYEEFMQIVNNECSKVKLPNQFIVEFKQLDDEEIGSCTIYLHKKEVFIDVNFWKTASSRTKKQLMFHELTHCLLGLHHVDVSGNYMYPYIEPIPENELIDQVKNNVKLFCNQKQ